MSEPKKFYSDFEVGQFYENEYLKRRSFESVHHPKDKKFKDYDIKNLESGRSYEIKADRKTKSTGNLFIEYKFKDEHSGINATKADYWVHYITEAERGDKVFESKRFIKIKTKKLRELINNNHFRTAPGGDNYLARGFLVPLKYVSKYIYDI